MNGLNSAFDTGNQGLKLIFHQGEIWYQKLFSFELALWGYKVGYKIIRNFFCVIQKQMAAIPTTMILHSSTHSGDAHILNSSNFPLFRTQNHQQKLYKMEQNRIALKPKRSLQFGTDFAQFLLNLFLTQLLYRRRCSWTTEKALKHR